MPDGWNHTQICLLPKIQKPAEMKDMRPISLCSVHYKIISNILCSRLKQVLPHVVSDTQGAFVSGRLITDNVIVAHEMVHGLRTKENVAREFMAVKTDMSKAYDRVEWCFLETLMEKMNFDRVWIRWIMACVSSVTYSVLLNGRSHGFIRPERGIRQGDPLSPFLFILSAEALVNCLKQSELHNRLHGIKLTVSSPSVHHLLFADDSLLMCRANTEESQEIIHCLKLYGEASGQIINLQKSSIIFGDKITSATKSEIKQILGIEKEGGDGSYLGLPECFKGSKRDLLDFIRDKLHGRLNGWFSKSLSQGGKEILIKSICLALPVYAMSVFKLPKDLCDKLTSAIIEFWWSSGNNRRKIPWVAWQKLCRRKEDGGLGFRDISKFNQALLGKQAWRIFSNPNSLVARVLRERYFRKSSFLDCGEGTRPSFIWRSILHGRDLLKQGLLRTIGDGKDTNVWSHNWIINPVPRPPMYRDGDSIDLTLSVADLLIPNTDIWDSTKVRQAFTQEDASIILKMRPLILQTDSHKWGFSKSGEYTTASGYRFLDELVQRDSPSHQELAPVEKYLWRKIWKVRTLPKIRHFFWKCLAGALPVRDRLVTRGIQTSTTCSQCSSASESINHLLFTCPFAAEVWERANIRLPAGGFSANSIFLNLYHVLSGKTSQNRVGTHERIFPWILWHLWKARNGLIFENTKLSPAAVLEKATEDATIWFRVNAGDLPEQQLPASSTINPQWTKPPAGTVKCNIGASWNTYFHEGGAAWIVRDHTGDVLFHSRRSFANITSIEECELQAMSWAVQSMKELHFMNVCFESSFLGARRTLLQPQLYPDLSVLSAAILQQLHSFSSFNCVHVIPDRNRVASAIANSVLQYWYLHSYVARGGPSWLRHLLDAEARS